MVLMKKSKYIKREGQEGGREGGREEIKEGKKAGQLSKKSIRMTTHDTH